MFRSAAFTAMWVNFCTFRSPRKRIADIQGPNRESRAAPAFPSAPDRIENDLRPSLVAGIEMPIPRRRLIQTQLVRYDKGGLGAAGGDQIPESPVVGLDVALSRADGETLV